MENYKIEDIVNSMSIDENTETIYKDKTCWLCEDNFHDFITKVNLSEYSMGCILAKILMNKELITLHYGGKDSRGHVLYVVIKNDSTNTNVMSREIVDIRVINNEKSLFEEMMRHYTNYFLGFLSN